MKIRFTQDTTVDVITEVRGDEVTGWDRETFNAGEEVEVDVFDQQDSVWGFQFGDGSIAFIPNDCWSPVV